MDQTVYQSLKLRIVDAGFEDEINAIDQILTNNLLTCEQFITEYIWVVISAGMKNQIAAKIYIKVQSALNMEVPINQVYGHQSKSCAIEYVFRNKEVYFQNYIEAENKLAYLESLPWIGVITKYHLARNLGLNVCKPDRHLLRIASLYGTTPDNLCAKLSYNTGAIG